MKIKLLEPIGVPAETIEEYARKLTEMGHEFEWFDTVATDPKELADSQSSLPGIGDSV